MSKQIQLLVITILIGGAIILLLNSFKANESTQTVQDKTSSSEIGQKASDFELEDFNGKKVKLSDFAGKPVFIDFWAAWCPFCIEETSEIEKVHQELGDKIIVLGIHRSETERVERGAQFAKERRVTYTLLKDSKGEVYKAFTGGRNFMPYAVYIDKNGVIKGIKAGPKTAEEIRQKVEELLQ